MQEVQETVQEVQESVAEAVQEVQESVAEAVQEVEERVAEAVQEVQESVAEAVQEVHETVQELQEAVTEAVQEVQESVAEAVQEVQESVTEVMQDANKTIVEVKNVLDHLSKSQPTSDEFLNSILENELLNTFTKDKKKEKDQDVNQKMAVACTLVLELYRMITSSLLILFVPQSCKGQLCSMTDNLKWNPNHHAYNFGICMNFITLFIFSCLYYVELKRENRLIKYLDVNPDMPSSNTAVQKTLEHISIEKRNKILSIDKYYQYVSYISIAMFILNSIVSAVIVNRYYLGSQTTTSLVTALLFMISKLANVYNVCMTEEHIFYSGYMKTFVQFNDLDKNHKNIDIL